LGGGQSSADGPPRVTLVYFLGGCTYAEISALRFLAQQENGMILQMFLLLQILLLLLYVKIVQLIAIIEHTIKPVDFRQSHWRFERTKIKQKED